MIAQALYCIGASLCFLNTYFSIGFIVLVQLYYATAPRFPGFREEGGKEQAAESR